MSGLSSQASADALDLLVASHLTFFVVPWTAQPGHDGSNGVQCIGSNVAVVDAGTSFASATIANPAIKTSVVDIGFGTATAAFTFSYYAIWSHASERTPNRFIGSADTLDPITLLPSTVNVPLGSVLSVPSGLLSISWPSGA